MKPPNKLYLVMDGRACGGSIEGYHAAYCLFATDDKKEAQNSMPRYGQCALWEVTIRKRWLEKPLFILDYPVYIEG